MTTFAELTAARIASAREAFTRITEVGPADFLPVFVAGSNACVDLRDFASLRVLHQRAASRAAQFEDVDRGTITNLIRVRREVLDEWNRQGSYALQHAVVQLRKVMADPQAAPWVVAPAEERVAVQHGERGAHSVAARFYAAAASTILEHDQRRAGELRERAADAAFVGEAVAALRAERILGSAPVGRAPAGAEHHDSGLDQHR